jgi:hypothetical protein
MATKKYQSIDQIRELTGKVYVRWSNSFIKDQKRGYSLRFGTQAEAGLSACEIDTTWEDWRILRKLTEYQFTTGQHCWIITGTEVSRGGDDEPLLQDIELIGEVDKKLLDLDWKKMQLEAYIAKDIIRLSNITDPIAINITKRSIQRYQDLLAKHLAGEQIPYIA